MKTPTTAKLLLAGAAMAGLLGGAAIRAEASTNNSNPSLNAGQLADSSTPDKHGCKGQNSCKGHGGLQGRVITAARRKNSCKGKGGCATDGSKS